MINIESGPKLIKYITYCGVSVNVAIVLVVSANVRRGFINPLPVV